MNKKLKNGFTLAEMMVVLLVLSIILAASVPLITKRTKPSAPRVVEKVIMIQVPSTSNGESFSIQQTTSSGQEKGNTSIQSFTEQHYSQTIQTESPVSQESKNSQNNTIEQNTQINIPTNDLNANIKGIQIHQVQNSNGEVISKPVITLENGQKYAIVFDASGQPSLKLEK